MYEKKKKNFIFSFLISAILYSVLTMGFRVWLTNYTDMRPTSAITPVLGMVLGLPATLGCVLGSVVCDLLSGYETGYVLSGIIQEFVYGIVPYFL